MKLKRWSICLVIALLSLSFISVAYGSTNKESEGNGESGKAANESSATDKKPDSPLSTEDQLRVLTEKVHELEGVADKVHKLEEIIDKQQRIIESMQPAKASADLKTANDANVNAATTAGSTAIAGLTATAVAAAPTTIAPTQPQSPVDQQDKRLDSLFKAFGQLSISGDLKFRFDTQLHQGFDAPTEAPDRNRARFRARLQLAGIINNNFDWAVRLTTGSFTNPDATNQTATDFFNRKVFAVDRAFIRYDSKGEKAGVILQAGKFDYPWKRTELIFDNDLQPEGGAETLYVKGKGFFKDARIVAFQLPFNEVTAGKDSVLYGGQLQSTVGRGNFAFTGAATYYNFNQTDAIARAINKPNTQVGGGVEFGSTNRLRLDSAGNIIGFASNFNILDIIGEIKYTRSSRFPVTLIFDYARNMSDRLDKLKERNAYWTGISVGQLKEKGDVEFTYTFDRVETDAVLGVFNFDDFLATNSRNNRFTAGYTLNKNIFFQVIGLFTQRFNTVPGRDSRVARRFQFDVNYRF